MFPAPFHHGLHPFHRFYRPYQDSLWFAFNIYHYIKKVVNAIAEIDISAATLEEHRFCALCPAAAIRMGCLVNRPFIGFGLHDQAAGASSIDLRYQQLAQQLLADPDNIITQVKVQGEFAHFYNFEAFSKDNIMKKGSLYLVPSTLGEKAVHTIPPYVLGTIKEVMHFIVENERSARRFLRSIGYRQDLDVVKMYPIGKHVEVEETIGYLKPVEDGLDMGLISEAGLPGVADPGALVVKRAHLMGIKVVPLVGPSSIFLALMASGLNGQSFCFHGYLPIHSKDRKHALKNLEMLSISHNQTQIFMEAPYRNNKLLEDVLAACHDDTELCIAINITTKNERIHSRYIHEWKKQKPDLHKQPAIFLIFRQ